MKYAAALLAAAVLAAGAPTATTANAHGASWEKSQTDRSTAWAGRGSIAKKCCV